jgi:uncharacterized protein YqjF (DUF2071 family)
MRKRRIFLSAEWRDLLLFNFAVPDHLLLPYLPDGIELDRYDGSAFVSLVAFDFIKTKVLGIAWPGHKNFAEINLRFYVKRAGVRGVVFVREIVPQHLTAWMARLLYNEPYVAAPIESVSHIEQNQLKKEFVLSWQGRKQVMGVTAKATAFMPDEKSIEHFFKEHEWGFGRSRSGSTTVYRVEHPPWRVYPFLNSKLDFDFAAVYGPQWAGLSGRKPDSVVFAEGSPIYVFSKDE